MSKPITNKEKLICQILVAKYDKDKLKSLLEDAITSRGRSFEVRNILRYLGIDLNYKFEELSVQYLNYAYENYEKIKDKIFPPEIERVVYFDFDGIEKKTVWARESYSLAVPGLKSKKDSVHQDVYDNFWDYDPDSVDTSWDDWETDSLDIVVKSTRDYDGNVIE